MDPLETPKHLIQIGDTNKARVILGKILYSDPHNLEAWELLSDLLDDPQQKADCYRKILGIDPWNVNAAKGLHDLTTIDDDLSKPEESSTLELSTSQQEVESSIDDLRQLIEDDVLEDSTVDQEYEERIDFISASQTDSRHSPDSANGNTDLDIELDEDQRSALPYLGPADIVKLAGRPLPQDERLKCPHCDATISRFESKCPWCSKDLPS
jgi:hypothetical protein